MDSKKICFLGYDFSVVGGVETTTYNLIDVIEKDKKIDVYSIKKSNDSSKRDIQLVPFYSKNIHIQIIYSFIYLYKKGYNTIVTNYFFFNLINSILSTFLNYKSIITEHASSKSYSFLKLICIFFVYRFSDVFVVINKYDFNFYKKIKLSPELIYNVYNYNPLKVKNDNNFFFICSRLDSNKRVHLALESYIKYRELGGKNSLYIAGDGPLFPLLFLKYCNVEGVKFLGMQRNVQFLMNNAIALLMTSKLECFPTTIIEAKFSATPTIAFAVPSGIPELICDNVDGFLVDDENIEKFSDCMLKLDSIAFTEKMKLNALSSSKFYSSNNSILKYKDIL